jgi:hypothetical protein
VRKTGKMAASDGAEMPQEMRKTAKLIVPPHYHSLGYRNHTVEVDLALDTPLDLKRAGSRNGDVHGMTLLFRGRKISPDEEKMTFKELIEKVCPPIIYRREADFV